MSREKKENSMTEKPATSVSELEALKTIQNGEKQKLTFSDA